MNQPAIIHAYYDLRVAPVSFDFATYLAIACATARKKGALLSVTLFYPHFRQLLPSERALNESYMYWKLNNVLVRLCHLCPTVVEVITNRSANLKFYSPHYPENYHPAHVDLTNSLSPVPHTPLELDAAMEGVEDRLIFKNTAYADHWFARRFGGRPIVTMNVRNTVYKVGRNTPLELWYQVYRGLSDAGYRVLVIPDQDDYFSDQAYSRFDWEVTIEACLDMDLRIALYRNSLGVIAWNGGPAALLPICGSNFIAFGVWNEANHVASRAFFERKGPRFGEQPHWYIPGRQRNDWREAKETTADYVVEQSLTWLRELPAPGSDPA